MLAGHPVAVGGARANAVRLVRLAAVASDKQAVVQFGDNPAAAQAPAAALSMARSHAGLFVRALAVSIAALSLDSVNCMVRVLS
jgi:hypothetical protein